MNPLTQFKNTTIFPVIIALTLGCFGLSQQGRAVDLPLDGGYPNQNTTEDDDALFSLTTGAENTAMGFDTLDSNTTGSDNALAGWIWRYTGSLNTARVAHTATLLQNGKVLVAGGQDEHGEYLASAELYDPASGTWSTTGSLTTVRGLHKATLLQNGMVLVVGGFDGFNVLASAELYDPASGTWSTTGSLNTARYLHTVTLLQNGKVLVAGGLNEHVVVVASAELYDPASGTWSTTGSLNTARGNHTATLLQNGNVLVAGGGDENGPVAGAELYNPGSGQWAFAGGPTHVLLTRRRCYKTAWSSLQEGETTRALSRARNCTTQPAGHGLPQAVSTSHVLGTRRRC